MNLSDSGNQFETLIVSNVCNICLVVKLKISSLEKSYNRSLYLNVTGSDFGSNGEFLSCIHM